MMTATRRAFLLSAAAAAVVRVARGASEDPIGAAAKVRQPAVGQSWRYAKNDFFTKALVDTQVDRVFAVGQTIELGSHSETTQDTPITYPSWGTAWWQKHMGHDRPAGPRPSEIQEPWGMVLVDPHWSQLQSYQEPNIWFAPEIGRWVVRESSGTFRQDVAEEFNESSYRWELLSWT
jgi:hypothetical protein